MFNRDAGSIPAALYYAERPAKIVPMDTEVAHIVQELKRQIQ